ncbi:MAG: diaminopimelate decarboxylase [Methyloligellaceae bacterium]
MHHFHYKNGVLHAEDVDLAALADEIGTPFYCYATATLERHYQVFAKAFEGSDTLICYSVKANSNLAVLRTLARLGSGMDVVSEGELRRVRAAGVPADRIVFSGVGKTRAEMAYALDEGIYAFNVESEPELEALSEAAAASGHAARVAFRVNPDIDPKTHRKISTGKAEDKFGVPWDDAPDLYRRAAGLPGIAPCGVHMHIGSQITDLRPFHDAFALLRQLVERLTDDGHTLEFINFGGGLGIPYRADEEVPPDPDAYAETVLTSARDLGCRLVFEPGRMISGNAGILVVRVLYTKRGANRHFTVIDGAMNDLIRPTLYEAHHEIWPVDEVRAGGPTVTTDVVGPVCETGDYLALGRQLPEFAEGDLIAIMTAGAYGAVQSSTYNSRLLVPEVLVKGDKSAVVRPRPSYDDLLSGERMPNWLTQT